MILTLICSNVFAEAINYSFQLNSNELEWLSNRIYSNECNSKFDCLTYWNEGEEFPSLGIGHFIWFHSEQNSVFEETFPQLIEFMLDRNAAVPSWLAENSDLNSPWDSRETFYANYDSADMLELRHFLAQQKMLQVEFIVSRFNQTLSQIVLDFPASDRPKVDQTLRTITTDSNPMGLYALIDYAHFKGTGLSKRETYNGQGWGLRQVLNYMLKQPASLNGFVESAEHILKRRVENAPAERDEQQWLPGWRKRLQTYLSTQQKLLR